ncbi:MAG: serine/threonine protein kinase, partial [Planctomycetaceae bacterium]|nr:serine/threonine protein kinase [Planctomycetaceae bacterium]
MHRNRAASGRQAASGGSAAGRPETGSPAGSGDSLDDGNVSRSSADLLADGAAAFDIRYWRNVARIGVQAARGLHYAHSQGTLHRDIKPGNLLLDHEGTVWIADFGLARMAEQEDLTRTGDLIGTLRYMAPEQFAGSSDARSDVYSLGLTLYELLTLRPACDETDRGRLIRQITDASPPPPRQLNPAIPRDLETIVLKAISRELPHRYQQASELAEDLGRWLEDRPIRARRARWGERLWRWSRRNRLAASLAGVSVVAVVLAAVTGWTGYVSTASALERASARRDEALAATSRAEANMALSLNALEQIFETLSTDSEWDSRNSSRDDIRLPGPPPPRPRGPEQGHDHDHDHSDGRGADRPYRESGAETGRPPGGPEREGRGGPRENQPPPRNGHQPPRHNGPGGAEASTRDAELLQTVLAFYDRFAELNSTNPELEREAARAHMRVAGLLLRRGQFEKSAEAAAHAEEIFARLLKTRPEDVTLLRGLATSHGSLARAVDFQHRNDGEDRLADARYRASEHVWLQVISQNTDDVAYDELDLAHTRLDWAGVLLRQKRLDEAVQVLRDSTGRLKRLERELHGPEQHRLCSLLGDSLGRLAEALSELGFEGQATSVRQQRIEVEFTCGRPPEGRLDGPPQEGRQPPEDRYRDGPPGGRPGGPRRPGDDRPPAPGF